MTDVLRVGNCSGFYGDRLSAMREMLEGGPLDVLTGDYLAELTMLILGRDQMKDPSLGYARTYVRQVQESLPLALEKGVKLVSNAGGLNPAGLADKLREVAEDLGLDVKVAHVDGDGLMGRAAELGLTEHGSPLTANAYLGAFGIAAALRAGADIVVTGRVTDASVVLGPAIAHFGWGRDDFDALAGGVVAGHVIECGTQATGGNFSGFREMLDAGQGDRPLGFPVAEISADGSCVITKHSGTGGRVSTDTVTAQLLYEVQSTTYLNPDVTTHLDTVELAQDGDDRVRVSGVRGTAPPATTKVCLNHLGGWRNQMELVLTGLDIDAKAEWVRRQVEAAWTVSGRCASVEWALARTDHDDATTEEAASARLRVTVRDADAKLAGKGFTAPLVELALASYPGFTMTTPPGPASPYGVYRPGYVPQDQVPHLVHHADGSLQVIEPPAVVAAPSATTPGANHPFRSSVAPGGPVPSTAPGAASADTSTGAAGEDAPRVAGTVRGESVKRRGVTSPDATTVEAPDDTASSVAPYRDGRLETGGSAAAYGTAGGTRKLPLGTFVHARSGDKGGDANLGLWVSARDGKAPQRTNWLLDLVTPELVKELLPEAKDLDVEVFALPNLHGVNVLIHGLLGEGVAASSRFDPQAKGLGEWARSRQIDIPEELL